MSQTTQDARTLPAVSTRTTASQNNATEIDLVELALRLLEKAKWIILVAVLGAVIAGLYTIYFVTPMYTATSGLYVVNRNDSAINLSDLQIGNYLASDYEQVFRNWHVQEKVIERLDLPYSYSQLNGMVSISNPSNTRILYIIVQSPDPQEAKLVADTFASVAQDFIAETMSTARPNVFMEALLPVRPTSPSRTRNVLIGFILGALLMAGIFTIQFITDDKIRSSEDITKYVGLATLGSMPMLPDHEPVRLTEEATVQ